MTSIWFFLQYRRVVPLISKGSQSMSRFIHLSRVELRSIFLVCSIIYTKHLRHNLITLFHARFLDMKFYCHFYLLSFFKRKRIQIFHCSCFFYSVVFSGYSRDTSACYIQLWLQLCPPCFAFYTRRHINKCNQQSPVSSLVNAFILIAPMFSRKSMLCYFVMLNSPTIAFIA